MTTKGGQSGEEIEERSEWEEVNRIFTPSRSDETEGKKEGFIRMGTVTEVNVGYTSTECLNV